MLVIVWNYENVIVCLDENMHKSLLANHHLRERAAALQGCHCDQSITIYKGARLMLSTQQRSVALSQQVSLTSLHLYRRNPRDDVFGILFVESCSDSKDFTSILYSA